MPIMVKSNRKLDIEIIDGVSTNIDTTSLYMKW